MLNGMVNASRRNVDSFSLGEVYKNAKAHNVYHGHCLCFTFEFKTVVDSVIRVPNSEFFVSGNWIVDLIVKGIVPESMSCISDSKPQYSGFHK